MAQFKKGDTVHVTQHKRNGKDIVMVGTIEEVVAKGNWPTFAKGGFIKGKQTAKRDHESYVVRVAGKDPLRWPRVSSLTLAQVQQNASPVPGATVTKTTVEETRPDGTVVKTTTEVTKPSDLDTDWVICLDSSGSMESCRDGAIKAFNDEVEAVKLTAIKEGLRMPRVTLYTFGEGSKVKEKFYRIPADQVQPLSYSTFRPDGGTPMFDGIGQAMHKLLADPAVYRNTNLAGVLRVITDGHENASHTYDAKSITRLFDETKSNWTHAFMVPKGHKQFVTDFGIPEGNVMEWDATNAGAMVASNITNHSVGSYMTQRSQGVSRVNSFYVQPDLSKLTAADLAQLTDLSTHFKVYTVEQEAPIKEYIEGKTGSKYVIGSGYYQLMKTEKVVQSHKGILLRDKFSKKIFGGWQARKLIGLPQGVDAKVEPGNHSNFDIFIQSTSVNRKLPKGTLVLHDKTQVMDMQPTWDHTLGAPNGVRP